MSKLTINEKEYNTDDFNEEQMSAFNEINIARSEMQRMDYLMRLLDSRCNFLANVIVKIAEEEPNEAQASK